MANTHDYGERSLHMHYEKRGKIEIVPTVPVKTSEDLSLAYTPGVATPCLVVTDGTAVLGLGDIGPEAGMPVMEGKCVLFKAFGNVDAFPLCIKSKDVDEIVNTVALISGSFGGVNLEDISAPRCFEIEKKLKERCDIPIFHDDQHGTAVVTLAGLINACKLTGRKPEETHIVVNGAGAAAIAISKLLISYGFADITLCDRTGIIYEGREKGMNPVKEEMAKITNKKHLQGSLADAVRGADVFVGVSAPGVLTKEMVQTMALYLRVLIQLQKLIQKMLRLAALLLLLLEEAIIQTRSIMYWHFQASSAVHLMFTQRKLTMR